MSSPEELKKHELKKSKGIRQFMASIHDESGTPIKYNRIKYSKNNIFEKRNFQFIKILACHSEQIVI